MKSNIKILLTSFFLTIVTANDLLAQRIPPKDSNKEKTNNAILIKKENAIDNNLVIVSPTLGQNVNGKIQISGKANPFSSVKIVLTATYYKYSPNYKTSKLEKGDGPLDAPVKNMIVKANGAGLWTSKPINFNNYGFSTNFKIVARSVERNNATFITVQNNKLPNIAWD